VDLRHLALWLSLCVTSLMALAAPAGVRPHATLFQAFPIGNDAVSSGCAQRAQEPSIVNDHEASPDGGRASTALEETARPQRPGTAKSQGPSPRGRASGGTPRPASEESRYAYDPAGRVTQIDHSDGTSETYAYRPDGELIAATNASTELHFERDPLGRIERELQGEHWVRSHYDALGRRRSVRSSKGLEQRIRRNAMGDVLAVEAGVHSLKPSGPDTPALDRLFQERKDPYRVDFERDRLGLELQRTLPGGVQARWHRDRLGRPEMHEIRVRGHVQNARRYQWDSNDRLRAIIDTLQGPIQFTHDSLGNLAAAAYADGRIDLRLPDAVGNLFKTRDRGDRKYGPAGQLLEATDARGVTLYEYDPEGNLVHKTEPDGKRWTYRWNLTGVLVAVERPDGDTVEFSYDPLGRRIAKTYRGKTTHWVWDGNVPLHEWITLNDEALARDGAPLSTSVEREIAIARRKALLAQRSAQGPPWNASPLEPEPELPLLEGTPDAPITWLFEPESFAPLAKLVAEERYSIVTDHLGTPRAMYDERGSESWAAEIDTYGALRDVRGTRRACPFRFPGQYEDAETGLYYNRFRYYDPEAGGYVSQDPIGLAGGNALYGYTADPINARDPLGLAASCGTTGREVDWDSKTGRFRDTQSGRFIRNKDIPWPANAGFSSRKPDMLTPGQLVDRYGHPGGNYLAPAGTPFEQRGLPRGYQSGKAYHRYEVVKPYSQVESGSIAPTPQFGSSGGGSQFMTTHSVAELVQMGVLKPI